MSIQGTLSLTCRHNKFVNTGLAFNRSVFEAIRASDFLVFRDGWDWSLFHLIQTRQMLNCQPDCQPRMLSPQVSRINNIGTTGVTMRKDDAKLQLQLNFPHVPDDVLEKGFDPSVLTLMTNENGEEGSRIDGKAQEVVTEALYLGYKLGFLNTYDWN